MSSLNKNQHCTSENYHWTSKAANFVKDSTGWLRNGMNGRNLPRIPVSAETLSPSSEIYSTKTKNAFVFNGVGHYDENGKQFDVHFYQAFQQKQLNNNCNDYEMQMENNICCSIGINAPPQYKIEGECVKRHHSMKEQQKPNYQRTDANHPTQLLIDNNNDSSLHFLNEQRQQQANALSASQSEFSSTFRKSASERRKKQVNAQQQQKQSEFIEELSSMTISLPSSSWQQQQQQQQVTVVQDKLNTVEDLATRRQCPENHLKNGNCQYIGLSSSGSVSPASPASPISPTNTCGNHLIPQRPLRRCRSASPAIVRPPLLTVEHQTLIRKSWQRVSKTTIGKSIYEKMIEKCKDISNFFEEDYNGIVRHRRYFVDLIQSAVDNLTDMDSALKPWLETIGKGHNGFSIKSAHWDAFGEAMICAVSSWVGPGKTHRETVRAWRLLFSFISDRLGVASRIGSSSSNAPSNHLSASTSTSVSSPSFNTPRIQLLNLVSIGPTTPPSSSASLSVA